MRWPKVGAVAAYNIVYYHAIQQAAYLEEHEGEPVRGGGAARAGHDGDALGLMRRHVGRMLAPSLDYTGALWEKMAPDGSSDELTGDLPVDGNSLAHGCATSPLIALSEHVLGVTPVEPGYAVWRVAPQLGALRWAQGEVPTPSGPIEVRWSRSRGTAAFGSRFAPPREREERSSRPRPVVPSAWWSTVRPCPPALRSALTGR